MNIRILQLVNILLLFIIFSGCQERKDVNQKEAKFDTSMKDTTKKESLLRHVVIFKFNDDATDEAVNKINQSFNNLAKEIPVIKDFEWGLNDSPENFHQDFTHCYMLTFDSEEDRDSIYTPHPLHQEFVASLGPTLEKVFVVDYWTKP